MNHLRRTRQKKECLKFVVPAKAGIHVGNRNIPQKNGFPPSRERQSRFFSLIIFSCLLSEQAISASPIIVAPQCLINKSKIPYNTLSVDSTFTLIQVSNAALEKLVAEKKHSPATCGGFRDVTRAWNEETAKADAQSFLSAYSRSIKPSYAAPQYHINAADKVNQLFRYLEPDTMWSNLIKLTGFEDRSATSDAGAAASDWIAAEIKQIANDNHRDDVTVYTVETGTRYKQRSVIAKMGAFLAPGIVIGAHMDTLSANNYRSKYAPKPGADDDGSGVVTVLEVARLLFASDMHFNKPVYFIWYAAEERGLVGADYVVADFKKKNIPINAVLQLDMTGYRYQNDHTMWLISDYVDRDLTAFLDTLITTYIKQPVNYTQCGYACSDHAIWTLNGYAAAMPSEAAFQEVNPDIHTSRDTMDKLSLDHMVNYAKLAIAFVVELAGVAG